MKIVEQMVHCAAFLMIALFGAQPATLFAAEPDALEIARKALENNFFSATNARATLELDISAGGKVVRQRRIRTQMKRTNGLTRAFVEFESPADVAGTKFLSVEEGPKETKQFIFLPAFKKVKRIVGSQRSQSFMGTDFAYSDLEGRDVEESTWKRMADVEVEGQACYVLEATPKNPEAEVYGRTVIAVHKEHMIPLKSELYTKGGQEVEKRLLVHKLGQKDGRWVAMDTVMESPKKGSQTRLKVLSLDLKSPIDDAVFTKEALER